MQQLFGDHDTPPDFDSALLRIREVVAQLAFELEFGIESQNKKSLTDETLTTNRAIETNVGLKATIPEIGAGGSASQQKSKNQQVEDMVSVVRRQLNQQNASRFLTEFLRQVQVCFDLECSVLLIDECSEASTGAQIEIFRLFKAIRALSPALVGKNNCAYFIGTVYPQGETYYPRRAIDGFSFELGQDCTVEFLQWDEADLDTYINFFQNMLLKRAQFTIGYEGTSASFIENIFENQDAFLLAAYCPHGIPRRFWHILRTAYDRSSHLISMKRVEMAIQDIAQSQILASGELDDIDLKVINGISVELSAKNFDYRKPNRNAVQNIYFSIEPSRKSNLRRLVMQGAIHDKSRTRALKRSELPQPVYALDIALAYTYRVIPHRDFVKVIRNDIPRAPERNFIEAIRFVDVDFYKFLNPEVLNQAEIRYKGVIKQYNSKNQTGQIIATNVKGEIYFRSSGIDKSIPTLIKVGDTVEFTLIKPTRYGSQSSSREKKRGFEAIKITLANDP